MLITHKIQLKPTKEQEIALAKACGCARFAYNWALDEWNKQYKAYKLDNSIQKPDAFKLKKKFNKIKEELFPWIKESPKDANQQAFTFLGKAFTSFFKGNSKYPQFKKKNKSKSSFYLSNTVFEIYDNKIKLPKIGLVKLTEELRFNGKINSASISKKSDKWFVSISVDVAKYKKDKKNLNYKRKQCFDGYKKNKNYKHKNIIGVDLGLKAFATLSNGEQFISPKPLKKYENKLKKEQRKLSKKVKGSNNYEKQKIKLSKVHYKISNIRNDFLHKLSHKLCYENQIIIMEDLDVVSMMKNSKLAKGISDAGWGELYRQVKYKSILFENDLYLVDKYYPSSKLCSRCHHKHDELTLSDRTFVCPHCGFIIDRDLNSSKNLVYYYNTLGHRGIYASGHFTSTLSSNTGDASKLVETRITQGNTL